VPAQAKHGGSRWAARIAKSRCLPDNVGHHVCFVRKRIKFRMPAERIEHHARPGAVHPHDEDRFTGSNQAFLRQEAALIHNYSGQGELTAIPGDP
jgi:hypothetical protein